MLVERGEVGASAASEAEAAEAAEARRVDAGERQVGLAEPGEVITYGRGLEEERQEAIDVGVVGEAGFERVGGGTGGVDGLRGLLGVLPWKLMERSVRWREL